MQQKFSWAKSTSDTVLVTNLEFSNRELNEHRHFISETYPQVECMEELGSLHAAWQHNTRRKATLREVAEVLKDT